jgi:hypothetical protein
MEPEMEHRLQSTNKAQLILLLQELAARHPQLLSEFSEFFEQGASIAVPDGFNEPELTSERNEEEWDFSGNTPSTFQTTPPPAILPLNLENYRQRFVNYSTLEIQDETLKQVDRELIELLKECEARVDCRDYHAALDLFSLLVEARNAEVNPDLSPLFDRTIDEGMPILETLLSEVSSHILFDAAITLSPLLSPLMRQQWLERLFSLWLKRLDRYHNEEEIPEIILDIAWSDDAVLLRGLVLKELQYSQEHTNIVDLTRQYRARALEKFLKELPHI